MQDSNLRNLAKAEAAVLSDYFKAKKATETTTNTTTETTTTETTTTPQVTTEPIATTTVPDTERIIGDVDGNGLLMVEDAIQILTYYAQKSANLSPSFATAVQQAAADFDGDNEITVEDAVAVLQCYAQQAAGLHPTLQLVTDRMHP